MSAANPNTAAAGTEVLPMIQAHLNAKTVAMAICDTRLSSYLKSGEKIDYNSVPKNYKQSYAQGTDMVFPAYVTVSDLMTVDQSIASNFTLGRNELVQIKDKAYQEKMAKAAAETLYQDIDQKLLKEGVDNAATTLAGGSLTVDNIYSVLSNGMSKLHRKNAMGTKFLAAHPEVIALMGQFEVGNGWNVADSAIHNGSVGNSFSGYKIFSSNNLPCSFVLTVAVQPTAGDLISFGGKTFTVVTDGTAANAGEINRGANLADFQAILKAAINFDTLPAAGDYVTESDTIDNEFRGQGIVAGSWSANAIVITGHGKLDPSVTFASGSNSKGAETGSMLAGDMGAISFVSQVLPELHTSPVPLRPQETYLSYSTLFAKKVFRENAKRLLNITVNL